MDKAHSNVLGLPRHGREYGNVKMQIKALGHENVDWPDQTQVGSCEYSN